MLEHAIEADVDRILVADRDSRMTTRPLAHDREPWERQPWEKSYAYACFVSFRDAGPTRIVGKRAGMAKRDRWQERTAAWDAAQQKISDDAKLALRRAAAIADAEREDKLLRVAQKRVLSELVRLGVQAGYTVDGEDETNGTGPPSMTADDVRKLLDTVTKWQRVARGESTDNTAVNVSWADTVKLALARGE